MLKKLKRNLVVVLSMSVLAVPMLLPAAASAANDTSNCVSTGASNLGDSSSGPFSSTCTNQNNGAGVSDLNSIIQEIVKWFSIIVGVIAVIMIIVGGFKYITSGGESNNVSSAKNTILFAIVGLIIVALAQFIVHFVLQQANTVGSGSVISALQNVLVL